MPLISTADTAPYKPRGPVSLSRGEKLASAALTETVKRATAARQLRNDANTFNPTKSYDIFLSHRYTDAIAIRALRDLLRGLGYSVYVDWIDDALLDRSRVNPATAGTLRLRMSRCRCLFYATTANHSESKWMPWELGWFDGKKQKAAIVPFEQPLNKFGFNGQEYLGIYPYIQLDNTRRRLMVVSQVRKNSLGKQVAEWFDDWLRKPVGLHPF